MWKQNFKLLCLALLPALFLVGCGKGDDKNATAAAAVNTGTCAIGQVYSPSYGCLQPAGQPNYGIYNGQMVSASCWAGTTATQSGCQPSNTVGNANYPYAQNQQYPTQQYPQQQYQQCQGRWYWNGYGWIWSC